MSASQDPFASGSQSGSTGATSVTGSSGAAVGSVPGTSSGQPAGGAAAGVPSSVVPTSTGQAAVAGSTGSGGAGGATVSHSAVEIGVFAVKDVGAATKAIGYDGLSTGDGGTQARASIAMVNAKGGLAGHPIKAVIFEYDATGNANTQFQAACSMFFDDHKVKAVVTSLLIPTVQQCAGKRGVPVVTTGPRTTSAAEYAKYPLLVVGSQPSLDRVVPLQVSSLVAQGWLTTTSKVGLLYSEDNDYAGVPALVAKSLKAAGMKPLTDQQSMPGVDDTSQVGTASSAGQSAALRFASKSVDRVLVVDKSGQAIAYFSIAAQNQGYYPAFGLTTLELPATLRAVLSARQLKDARGIGWSPLQDQPVAEQKLTNANQKACLAAMTKAGQNMSATTVRAAALGTCDSVLLLGAAWVDNSLTTASFSAGVRQLGSSYASVTTLGTDFSSHRDGSSLVRPFAYTASCDCFRYTAASQRLP